MQPVSQGVSSLDLQKLRQHNEEALQARATNQMGAELKAGSGTGVSKDEKLTAGQGDQVDLTPKDKKAIKTPSPDSVTPPPSSTANTASSAPTEQSSSPNPSETHTPEDSGNSGGDPPPADPGNGGNSQKPLYSESQQAFLNRLRELEDQRKTLSDMWRKNYMDWMADQLQAAEDYENFRQSTGLLWTDVTTARWVQGARHSEAVRSIL
ncbi:hypothetical protein JST97_14460 [bacterium]|nr:hypothetical protein [bacterium]